MSEQSYGIFGGYRIITTDKITWTDKDNHNSYTPWIPFSPIPWSPIPFYPTYIPYGVPVVPVPDSPDIQAAKERAALHLFLGLDPDDSEGFKRVITAVKILLGD